MTEVAKYQRLLILAVLGYIIVFVAGIALQVGLASGPRGQVPGWAGAVILLLNLAALGVVVLGIVSLVMVMSAMEHPIIMRVLAVLSLFIPIVGLIVLLVVNARATAALREAGYTVGLLGAKK